MPQRRNPLKVTLNDVARQLGVSRATVSNAFNRPELLARDMLERIKAKSLELGYFGPDPMARALRRKEIQELAVVFHHDLRYAFSDPSSVQFLGGVASELDARNLALHLIPQTGRRGSLEAAFQTTAAAMIIHDEVVPDLVAQLLAVRKPLSVVDTCVPGLPSVQIEDRGGARAAMDYVIGQGAEHIVVLCMTLDIEARAMTQYEREATLRTNVGAQRVQGYFDSLNAHRIERSRVTWMEVSEVTPEATVRSVLPTLLPLLEQHQVGIVAMTDRTALAVLSALQDCGRRARALVGFDDIPEAAVHGLTTIRQDAHKKGVMAVRAALDGIGSVCLPVELVRRST